MIFNLIYWTGDIFDKFACLCCMSWLRLSFRFLALVLIAVLNLNCRCAFQFKSVGHDKFFQTNSIYFS